MFLLKSTIRTLTQARRSLTTLEHLKTRSLIRVAGAEVPDFLQGLITNDIHHLDHGMSSLYAMFLNTKGRVLYDTLIYKTTEENVFLIECDSNGVQSLIKHLKLYRVRRKIDVDSLESEYDVYTMFNPDVLDDFDKNKKRVDGVVVPCDALNETEPEKKTGTLVLGDVLVYRDPRAVALGSRVLAQKNSDVRKEVSKIAQISNDSEKTYRWFRYNLGIGEGIQDLPPNDCFPLESNCDYLHGVSFHKGCYIGQELTARTHHTGVVRKRLMPLFFKKELSKSLQDNKIIHDGVNLGKLRGVEKEAGLGLLRIAQAVEIKNIKIGDGIAATGKPNWWPLEAPKEKMTA